MSGFTNHLGVFIRQTVYVDVDGTLVFWPGNRPGRYPRKGESGHGEDPAINTKLVERLKASDADIVIWSRGGKTHAEWAAKFCDIDAVACLSKPDLMVDDGRRWMDTSHSKGMQLVGPHDELKSRRFTMRAVPVGRQKRRFKTQ